MYSKWSIVSINAYVYIFCNHLTHFWETIQFIILWCLEIFQRFIAGVGPTNATTNAVVTAAPGAINAAPSNNNYGGTGSGSSAERSSM